MISQSLLQYQWIDTAVLVKKTNKQQQQQQKKTLFSFIDVVWNMKKT